MFFQVIDRSCYSSYNSNYSLKNDCSATILETFSTIFDEYTISEKSEYLSISNMHYMYIYLLLHVYILHPPTKYGSPNIYTSPCSLTKYSYPFPYTKRLTIRQNVSILIITYYFWTFQLDSLSVKYTCSIQSSAGLKGEQL